MKDEAHSSRLPAKLAPASSADQPGINWLRVIEAQGERAIMALAALALAVYLATVPLPRIDGMLIGSDGVGYYMYVRSLVIDGDLDFANEYRALKPEQDLAPLKTATGLTANQYAVGPAILWMPFFLVAHGLALAAGAAGLPVVADGYGYIYQAAICLGSIVYGSAGMLLILRTVRLYYPDVAVTTCALLWLAGNMIYYLIVEPSMSHMCSLVATALLVYLWLKGRRAFTPARCLGLGLAGGLVALVRQPDATLLLMPVLDLVLAPSATDAAGSKRQARGRAEGLHDAGGPIGVLWAKSGRLALIGAGFGLVFWPQALVWAALNGSPLLSGYFRDGEQGFNWFAPRLLEVLFADNHGLLLWHPIYLFAIWGLLLVLRTDRLLGGLLLAGLASQIYLIAAWSAWWQGDAFGGRMFIASLPIFALGLAAFLSRALARRNMAPLVAALSLALILWNALFLVQYRAGYIAMSGPYSLRELTLGKAEMLVDLLRRLL